MNRRLYNCGGYALQNFQWVDVPRFPGLSRKKEIELLKAYFSSTHKIISKKEAFNAKKEEVIVAFKIAIDDNDDYHFMRKGKNNQWKHKMGSFPYILNVDKELVFSNIWDFSKPITIKGRRVCSSTYKGETIFMKLE